MKYKHFQTGEKVTAYEIISRLLISDGSYELALDTFSYVNAAPDKLFRHEVPEIGDYWVIHRHGKASVIPLIVFLSTYKPMCGIIK